jgi:mRNA-degrading endonuclease RelE of RelBE toxin-antitoxin system
MIFIEFTPFVAFRERYWTDETFGGLQRFLFATPDAGNLLRGGGGLRKVRWQTQGRGKRGGARVIYYWHVQADCIYLVYGYAKARREDLTARQVRALQSLLGDLRHG